MMKDINEAIDEQKERLFSSLSSPSIVGACNPNNGIMVPSKDDKSFFMEHFRNISVSTSFFIPASGVGSRMFDFLQRFLGTLGKDQKEELDYFFNQLPYFAFYDEISSDWKERIRLGEIDLLHFCDYLLSSTGLNFSGTPKALFPFHRVGADVYSPLQRHLQQGKAFRNKPSFHFTIQNEHLSLMQEHLDVDDSDLIVQLSLQDPDTHSFVFDEFKQPVLKSDGNYLKRPSGHGALLFNLSQINSDIVFVKNIDNIQCPSMDEEVNHTWEMLGGILHYLRSEIRKALALKDAYRIEQLNERFHFSHQEEKLNIEEWNEILNRPMRVCGMVPNLGMPGGGPFWIEHQGKITKQIIEKSQIDQAHLSTLSQSSHFNPVMMALSLTGLNNEALDLSQFVRKDLSMAVQKNHFGKTVYYLERPGLWNGSMYDWTTVFVEVPSAIFSPVKSVMDLLAPCHRC